MGKTSEEAIREEIRTIIDEMVSALNSIDFQKN